MPVETITSRTTDACLVKSTTSGSWADIRGNASSSADNRFGTQYSNTLAIYNRYAGGRGGNTYYLSRSVFPFRITGITTGTITAASVKFYLDNMGSTGDYDDVILIGIQELDDDTSDYGKVFETGTTYNDVHAERINVSTTAGYHTFTLNSTAIESLQGHMAAESTQHYALVGFYSDYQNNAPSLNGDYTKIYCRYSEYSGSTDPTLTLTIRTEENNATFFGSNF